MAHHLAETGTKNIFRRGGFRRHWVSGSEVYAPVEVLLQCLYQGWEPDNPISVETFFSGRSHSEVYHFSLRRGGMFTVIQGGQIQCLDFFIGRERNSFHQDLAAFAQAINGAIAQLNRDI
jgi:hypothetical protein